MKGTCLADYMCEVFQENLQQIKETIKDFYGVYVDEKTGTIRIDGACGIGEVEKVINALGLKITLKDGKNDIYILKNKEVV